MGNAASAWERFRERVARLYAQNAPQDFLLRRIGQQLPPIIFDFLSHFCFKLKYAGNTWPPCRFRNTV